MLRIIKQMIPGAVKRQLKGLLPPFRRLHCPICGTWDRHFLTDGHVPRPDARCPTCESFERHRLVWLFFQRKTDLFSPVEKKMLHFAPESMFSSRFSTLPHLDYLTADLLDPSAMAKVDITQMQFPDETFDVLYCSHVLEHVPDDRKAMRECRRVLKRTGWAVFMVPLAAGPTVEDPSVTDPKERERRFGQPDHVRMYGPDFADRLRETGFVVSSYSPADVVGSEAARYGIPPGEGPVFFCRK
jgi:hypothetical protein